MLGYKSRSSINKIELGDNDIPHAKILDFAKALECSPIYLLGFDDIEPDTYALSDPDADKYEYPSEIKIDRDDVMIISKKEQEILKKLRSMNSDRRQVVENLIDMIYVEK